MDTVILVDRFEEKLRETLALYVEWGGVRKVTMAGAYGSFVDWGKMPAILALYSDTDLDRLRGYYDELTPSGIGFGLIRIALDREILKRQDRQAERIESCKAF